MFARAECHYAECRGARKRALILTAGRTSVDSDKRCLDHLSSNFDGATTFI
jgi:hypothetical protein